MKRLGLTLLALLLSLSMILIGCGPEEPVDPADPPEQPPSTETDSSYTVTESYLPSSYANQMKTLFESADPSFATYEQRNNAPLAIPDFITLSDCTLKSITIPVLGTGEAEGGYYIFTLHVVSSDYAGLKRTLSDPLQTIEIEISASKYNLKDNDVVYRFIKVDLENYKIKLGKNESLAFGAATDSIYPAQVNTYGLNNQNEKNPAAKLLLDEWGVTCHYYINADDSAFSISQNSLLFDFELERTYESKDAYDALMAAEAAAEAEYQQKLAAVKAAYSGKYISMIGDSISTCEDVTNNTEYNTNLWDNDVYANQYKIANGYNYSKVYWGKLAVDTEMNLCVMNGWSGGRVYGGKRATMVDNMLTRSYQLANNQGVNPDLIVLYFGINDIGNSPSSIHASGNLSSIGKEGGDLYQRLTANTTKTQHEIVDEWFAEVQQQAATSGYVQGSANNIIAGTTYTCWEAAYALSLQNILASYDNPEVYIMTLIETNAGHASNGKLDRANTILRALAEYFGVGIIDQQKGYVNQSNCHIYAYDTTGLHPDMRGHALMARLIVETLYENLNK